MGFMEGTEGTVVNKGPEGICVKAEAYMLTCHTR